MSAPGSKKRRHAAPKDPAADALPVCPVTKTIAYPSRKRALTAMNQSRAFATEQRPGPRKVFRCEHGSHWHMSSQAPAKGGEDER
jgi:hypothetical protein